MNHIKAPIIFENAFTEEDCNYILSFSDDNFKQAELGENNALDSNVRKSETKFMSDEKIYNKLNNFFLEANKMGNWNFQFDWFEPAQITKYGIDNYYKWHCDDHDKIYPNTHDNPNFRNKIRKISCSLLLSDINEYSGGGLEFAIPQPKDGNLVFKNIKLNPLKKGALIVFPSFINHKVNVVTNGCRYSLVVWALGKPYA